VVDVPADHEVDALTNRSGTGCGGAFGTHSLWAKPHRQW
jgi:hypothetical protein